MSWRGARLWLRHPWYFTSAWYSNGQYLMHEVGWPHNAAVCSLCICPDRPAEEWGEADWTARDLHG